jgi:hypothetical protein
MFYKVYNDLGVGFLEKVYENALAMKLRQNGLTAEQQAPILVHYEGATQIEVGLILNFGPTPQFKRLLLTNDRKQRPSTKAK